MRIITVKELPKDFFSGFRREDAAGVRRIVEDVRRDGDAAVRHYSRLIDGVARDPARLPKEAAAEAAGALDSDLREALLFSARNIGAFAAAQKKALLRDFEIETVPGVFCGQRTRPIGRIGLYVPAGRRPLVSSLLMGAIPALEAGVGEIAVFSPPSADGGVHPLILGAAGLLGLDEIYAVGGAQAVAAMAFGTETIPRVDKIVGPGNRYVAAAKLEIFGTAGIDLPAGPSEVMIVAGGDADAEIAAADLLAQSEHDPDASAVLLTDSRAFADGVREAIRRATPAASDVAAAEATPAGSGERFILVLDALEDAVGVADRRAPEHLELLGQKAAGLAERFRRFGAVFFGTGAGEVFGDYAAGTNHILPTGGAARFVSGLGVRDFLLFQTTLRFSEGEKETLIAAAERLARAEGLSAHAAAAGLRRGMRPAGPAL